MSITRAIRRVCNYVTWYNKPAKAIRCVQWHKTLTRGQRKQWSRLPARKRVQMIADHQQVATNSNYPQWKPIHTRGANLSTVVYRGYCKEV